MIRQIRDSYYEFREQWTLNQRAYCYLRGVRIGYATPLRDGWFTRPWAWVAYGWDKEMLGVFRTFGEASTRCHIVAYEAQENGQIQIPHPTIGRA